MTDVNFGNLFKLCANDKLALEAYMYCHTVHLKQPILSDLVHK